MPLLVDWCVALEWLLVLDLLPLALPLNLVFSGFLLLVYYPIFFRLRCNIVNHLVFSGTGGGSHTRRPCHHAGLA